MLAALCEKLAIVPCMRLEDMVTFLRGEFEVEVSRFSIRRALKDVDWSKKATQNIAQERNPDLRDEYMHDLSAFRSEQRVFIDESGVDMICRPRQT
jgi:hypothetical protein